MWIQANLEKLFNLDSDSSSESEVVGTRSKAKSKYKEKLTKFDVLSREGRKKPNVPNFSLKTSKIQATKDKEEIKEQVMPPKFHKSAQKVGRPSAWN